VSLRRGIAWTSLAGGIMGALDAVATVLLLRYWLGPEEYGIAALATTLFPLLDLVADAGLSAAIIARGAPSRESLSSAQWAATGAALVVALALLGLGPALAALHGEAIVAGLLAGYGAKLVLQQVHLVPIALLRRELRFGAVARLRIAGALAETAAKLIAAAAGAGPWCFLVGQLAKTGTLAVGAQLAYPFRPRLHLRRAEVRAYLQIGGRTSASQVLFHLYTGADYQIVGAVFGPVATGLYRAAYELVLEPAKLLSYIVVEVAFPVFSRARHDLVAVRAHLIALTRHNLAVLLPVLAVIAAVPAELLTLAFGPAWAPAADAVALLCAVGALRGLAFLIPPLLDGCGRPDLTLRYTIVAAVVVPSTQLAAALTLGDTLGWRAVALAWAVSYPVAFAWLLALGLRVAGLSARAYASAVALPLATGGATVLVALAVAALLPPAGPLASAAAVALAAALVGGTGAWLTRGRRTPSAADAPVSARPAAPE
jgi:PST family polysaccharide transporter